MTQGWLTGWKAIGNYLDVHWTTVRRWHKFYHFPVVKFPNESPSQKPEVIDAWIKKFDEIQKRKK
jgi:hypothetical protein